LPDGAESVDCGFSRSVRLTVAALDMNSMLGPT
jgi:hypothetical protein